MTDIRTYRHTYGKTDTQDLPIKSPCWRLKKERGLIGRPGFSFSGPKKFRRQQRFLKFSEKFFTWENLDSV